MVSIGGRVDRGLSIMEQAPLGRVGTPSSLLSFRLSPVVLWRTCCYGWYVRLIVRHSRVSNPSLCPEFRRFKK